jgi:hypothetical protein
MTGSVKENSRQIRELVRDEVENILIKVTDKGDINPV